MNPSADEVVVPYQVLARLRTSFALLQQNSEGCALNHYGSDADKCGLPGWLADTGQDLAVMTDLLSAAPAPSDFTRFEQESDKPGKNASDKVDVLSLSADGAAKPQESAVSDASVSERSGEVERIAAAIFEADPDHTVSWADWLDYVAQRPVSFLTFGVENIRRQARAVAALSAQSATDTGGSGLDWLKVAKAAGKYGVRYSTNSRLEAFLHEIVTPSPKAGDTIPAEREWPDIGTDPLKAPRPDDRYEASRLALREAYVKQQPHVPDQTALVWRWHLGAVLEMALRLKAISARLATPIPATGSDEPWRIAVWNACRARGIGQDAAIALIAAAAEQMPRNGSDACVLCEGRGYSDAMCPVCNKAASATGSDEGKLREALKRSDLLIHWDEFCDAEPLSASRDIDAFLRDMEMRDWIECVRVDAEALEDPFASDRGIEPDGMMWRLTPIGLAVRHHLQEADRG